MKKIILGLGVVSASFLVADFSHASAEIGGRPCGLNGEIRARIADCNFSVGKGNEYQLVTRTLNGNEIYRGRRTGVIWSADIDNRPKNYAKNRVETICDRERPEFGGIRGKWILPSIHRYIQGFRYDIQESLPGLNRRTYWSETSPNFYVTSRYVMEGSRHYVQIGGKYEIRHLETDHAEAFVKCVIEPAE